MLMIINGEDLLKTDTGEPDVVNIDDILII